MKTLGNQLVHDSQRTLYGGTWAKDLENGYYPIGQYASEGAARALNTLWEALVHESARIVEADLAGTLVAYLASKEK